MKAPVIGLMLALSLSGCNAGALLTPPAGKVQPGTTNTSTTALRLGSLQFQPASAQTMAKLSQRASGAAAPTAAPAPMAAEASMGVATDAKMAPSPYAFGTYFGGPFGQMKLDSVSEATAAGASTGFLELQSKVIGPALADWAADARLLNTNGTLDEAGNPVQGAESYPGELAWHASYASISRNEVLDFSVSAKETRVVRMHWVPTAIDVAGVSVDAKAAVETLAKAVTSRVRSKEEELGHDYFFDASQPNMGMGVGIAVPAVAVAPTIAVGEPAPQGPTTEILYRLKAGGRWNVTLQAIGDHLVWELNYNTYYASADTKVGIATGAAVSGPTTEPMPMPAIAPAPPDAQPYQPEPWTDESAYGMVDARTGELIRLRRPTKYTYPAVTDVKPTGGLAVRGGTTTSSTGGTATPDGKL